MIAGFCEDPPATSLDPRDDHIAARHVKKVCAFGTTATNLIAITGRIVDSNVVNITAVLKRHAGYDRGCTLVNPNCIIGATLKITAVNANVECIKVKNLYARCYTVGEVVIIICNF